MLDKGDANGKFILLSQMSFLWYANIIGMFYTNKYAIPFLGVCIVLSIVIDLNKMYPVIIGKIPTSLKMLLLFFALVLPWGLLGAISIKAHIETWISSVEYLLVMIAIIYYALSRNNIRPILWNVSLIVILQCIMFLAKPVDLGGGLGRYSLSAQLNPNGFAIGLTQGLWTILCLMSIKKLPKALGLICVGMIFYSIILTGSRKGLIGALIILGGWFLFSYLSNRSGPVNPNKLISVFLIIFSLLLLYIVLIPYYNNSSLSNRMTTLADEASTGSRSRLYAIGISDFLNHMFLGYGFGGFKELHGVYSHTTIIEVLVSCGLPIAVFYFCIYFVIAKEILQKQSALKLYCGALSDEAYYITRMGIGLFAALLFYSTCIVHIYEISSMISFGLLFSAYSYISLEDIPDESKDSHEKKVSPGRSKYIREGYYRESY